MSKRKKIETIGASTSAPKRKSVRIARQESLTGATSNLRISSGSSSSSRSSYDLKDLPSSASRFVEEDMEALNATFKPASNENEVIPDVEATNFPDTYALPNIRRSNLEKPNFNVNKFGISDGNVKTFFDKLHRVRNMGIDIGTEESKTDSLVNHLLTSIVTFETWPLAVRVKERYRLSVSDKNVSVEPDYVVDKQHVVMIVVKDKHLKNVKPTDFGEAQMLAEILACGSENLFLSHAFMDQTIFAVRVISSYVTFYKAEIPAAYWRELKRGLPRKQSVTILRWPGENGVNTGLNLAEPAGRRSVLTALCKIRESLLQEEEDEQL